MDLRIPIAVMFVLLIVPLRSLPNTIYHNVE